MLFIKGLPAYIKYIINLLEMVTLGRYESKMTIFSVIEFIFTVTRLLFQIAFFFKISNLIGVPYYMILDFIDTLRILAITLKNFFN